MNVRSGGFDPITGVEYLILNLNSTGRVGLFDPGSTPLDCIIQKTFNFLDIERIAMRRFAWNAGFDAAQYTGASNGANFYIAWCSNALSAYDPRHYQTSNYVYGPSVFETIPVFLNEYVGTSGSVVKFEYQFKNLNWRLFSSSNTMGEIDVKIVTAYGDVPTLDAATPDAGEWEAEFLMALKRTPKVGQDFYNY